MCQVCDVQGHAVEQEKIAALQSGLDNCRKFVSLTLQIVGEIEDNFREAGLQYHRTELSARRVPHLTAEQLQRLKEAFESSYQVYLAHFNSLFARISAFPSTLTDCQLEFSQDCLTIRYNRYRQQVKPAHDSLYAEWDQETTRLMTVMEDAGELRRINLRRGRNHWYRDLMSGPHVIPSQPEWNPYVLWAASLPETQHMLVHRPMLDIAKDILCRGEDGEGEVAVSEPDTDPANFEHTDINWDMAGPSPAEH
ncbi:hypothetical protein NX059_005876 [Plenodomus lindquistii]|nr:hypothetical protein NX059_005876 [Plenodomus lindquistii]